MGHRQPDAASAHPQRALSVSAQRALSVSASNQLSGSVNGNADSIGALRRSCAPSSAA